MIHDLVEGKKLSPRAKIKNRNEMKFLFFFVLFQRHVDLVLFILHYDPIFVAFEFRG